MNPLPTEVRLISKDESLLMRFIGFFHGPFIRDFWTTYRLPFCRPVIAHPPHVARPLRHVEILEHEMYHVRQLAPWYGPLVMGLGAVLLPLPVLFSGRWFIERHAYLNDIRHGRLTLDYAVWVLWHRYGYSWPRCLMMRWFKKRLAEGT